MIVNLIFRRSLPFSTSYVPNAFLCRVYPHGHHGRDRGLWNERYKPPAPIILPQGMVLTIWLIMGYTLFVVFGLGFFSIG